MTDRGPSIDPHDLPTAVAHGRRGLRVSLVWAIPLIAIVVGGWIVVHERLERGAMITVRFGDAEGIEAGKTHVRYKNVDVGEVKQVILASDMQTVLVFIEMARFADPLLMSDTRFWVVRPRLGMSGVSGLGTLLSGAYIGVDAGSEHEVSRQFVGMSAPPAITGGTAGREFILNAHDLGSLAVGSPLYFRHIQVGRINALTLDADGQGVTLRAFVEAPYDHFVTADTRFWHASGVDVAVDAGGIRVQTESLATILAGGIAFEAPPSTIEIAQAPAEAHFELAANRQTAFKQANGIAEAYVLYFEESVRGLALGAPVNFRGIDIGEVASLRVEYDRAHKRFRFPVLVNIYPARVRALYQEGSDRPDTQSHVLVATLIGQGLRAQLHTGSLLTGQLFIALDFFPHAPAQAADPQLTPMPLPTIPGNLAELQDSIMSIARKLDHVPLDKIGRELDQTLVSLNQVLGTANSALSKVDNAVIPQVEGALHEASATLLQANGTLKPDSNLQADLHDTLQSVSRAADSVRLLSDYLEQHPEALIRGKIRDSQ
jgi:paraquat-inducible protein B